MPSKTKVLTETRALVCEAGELGLEQIALEPLCSQDVLVDVVAIGLCRTDLYAISGQVKTWSPRFIPGHEFSGIVAGKGQDVNDLQIGDRVVVNPLVGCGVCEHCKAANGHLCSQTKFMGVDFDGACREQIAVPRSLVFRVPETVPFEAAAFAEPLAATLAILKADIYPEQSGLIIGSSRITELARRVLTASKFAELTVATLDQAQELASDQFDFVVETEATSEVFAEMVRLAKPRGVLVLKSRDHRPFEVTLRDIVQKEPRISAVHYGRFDQAIQWLIDRKVRVDDLVGKKFQLANFDEALKAAANDETKKTFLRLGD